MCVSSDGCLEGFGGSNGDDGREGLRAPGKVLIFFFNLVLMIFNCFLFFQ